MSHEQIFNTHMLTADGEVRFSLECFCYSASAEVEADEDDDDDDDDDDCKKSMDEVRKLLCCLYKCYMSICINISYE